MKNIEKIKSLFDIDGYLKINQSILNGFQKSGGSILFGSKRLNLKNPCFELVVSKEKLNSNASIEYAKCDRMYTFYRLQNIVIYQICENNLENYKFKKFILELDYNSSYINYFKSVVDFVNYTYEKNFGDIKNGFGFISL